MLSHSHTLSRPLAFSEARPPHLAPPHPAPRRLTPPPRPAASPRRLTPPAVIRSARDPFLRADEAGLLDLLLSKVGGKSTGLAQILGQSQDSARGFQSKCWANLQDLDQACGFFVVGAALSRPH